MKSSLRNLPAIIFSLIVMNAGAAVRYVNVNSANPTSPYTNWATAATTIQQAIDVAMAGDEVLVTNGVYQTGARAVGGLNNRVVVAKPVTVQSVNGPAATQIVGYQVPVWTNGSTAVRCVYLANGATLVGFTLSRGATQSTASSDISTSHHGGGVWCDGANSVVSNCVLTGNSAALNGGGASGGTLNDCTLTGNSASYGGGVSGATLNNCTLIRNSSHDGGGAYYGTLNNCVITENSAKRRGGGATSATLNNCRVTGNSAVQNGGGVSAGSSNTTLNNCTLTGNSAGLEGGGAYLATLNNCIVYYNTAPTGENYAKSTLNFSCTTPLPAGGPQNLSDEPQLASMSYLSTGSPCIGRGSVTRASGVDMDGEPWANPPSIGCDEYWSGSVTGAVSVAVVTTYAYVPVGFDVNFQALIDGRVNASRWDFGDGSVVSNRPYASHAWKAVGDYPVELRAFNESYPTGIATTVTVRVLAPPVHYVSLTGTNPVTPYSSWATAATNIQDAIDAAAPGGLIWVSNGVYQTGGVFHGMSNRVAVTKAVTVRSVNGPSVTQIVGYKVPGTMNGSTAVRCVYLTNGAVLAGFTLTNGATQTSGDFVRNRSGGGILCEGASAIVSNCVLVGNSAYSAGGGTYSGTLNNCTVIGNYAADGGGAFLATLNDSTLVGNLALRCGGADECTMNNCIVYYNYKRNSSVHTNFFGGTLKYCCTTPIPVGPGNLTNAPSFVNTNNWSDLRLQSNSPCINAGNNAFASGPTDLDSNPRIVGGTVDLGAYEFQTPVSAISYAWLQQYGLPTDGTADFTDTDGEGLNNWQEWRAGTVPTNALSALRMLSPTGSASGITLSWESVNTRNYWLERASGLSMQPVFSIIAPNLAGQAGTTTYTDTNATVTGPFFYRVGVQP